MARGLGLGLHSLRSALPPCWMVFTGFFSWNSSTVKDVRSLVGSSETCMVCYLEWTTESVCTLSTPHLCMHNLNTPESGGASWEKKKVWDKKKQPKKQQHCLCFCRISFLPFWAQLHVEPTKTHKENKSQKVYVGLWHDWHNYQVLTTVFKVQVWLKAECIFLWTGST